MKLKILLGVVVVLITAAGFWFANQKENTVIATVRVTDQDFEPATITVKKGTKVEFINDTTVGAWPASDLHPTHGIYPEFDPQKSIPPGQKWEFAFKKAGEWKYHDHLNPTRRGTVKVE